MSRLLDRNPASRSAAFPALKDLLGVRTSAPRQACFIGRWKELREAGKVLDTKVEKVQILTIEGETGIGKTRFVDELAFRKQLQADRFLRGRCYERENRQYEPILQVIGDRLKWRDQELESWIEKEGPRFAHSLNNLLPEFGELLPEVSATDGPLLTGKVVADLVGILISIARLSPTWIVLEDLHWVDEGTLKVLEQIFFRAGESDLCLVLTLRLDSVTGEIRRFLEGKVTPGIDLERISLKPLQPRDALDLAQELTEDVRKVSWVVKSGGGNPLFLEECARYQAPPTGGKLPSKMEDIIVQTAARLSSGSNEMVSLLSLFPKPIPIHLAKRITGATVVSAKDEIQRLLQSGVVVTTGNALAFRHDGIREAIYGNLPISKRKELHRSVCNLLVDASGDDEAVAYHQARAGLLRDAVATYERAARFNWEHHNYRTAEECFASATKFRKRLGEVPCELNLEYARCLKLAGKRKQAKRILEGVLQGSSTSNEVRVLAYWNLADICRENPAASVRLYRLALSYAGESSPASVELLLSMAQVVGLAGRVAEADNLLAVAKKLLKVLGNAEDPNWLASITGNVLISLCEHNRALKTLRAVHRPDTLDTNLLNNIAVCLEHLGKLDEACAYQLKALEVSRRLGRLSAELQSLGACRE